MNRTVYVSNIAPNKTEYDIELKVFGFDNYVAYFLVPSGSIIPDKVTNTDDLIAAGWKLTREYPHGGLFV